MIIGLWRPSVKLLANSTWTGRILGNISGVLLIVGAAGGLQRLCQETGMAELLGERLLEWHFGAPGGLLIPFLIAALIKTLQGSSLVAAITTAGMVQPILAPLGIADESGKALAALAIGVGAMTVSHVNDEFFWLVTESAGFAPLRGLATGHCRHAAAGPHRDRCAAPNRRTGLKSLKLDASAAQAKSRGVK